MFKNVDEKKIRDISKEFAAMISKGSVVLLQGDLGAGKTTFVRYLVEALGGNPRMVTSPTFTIVNEYDAHLKVYHVDLFRLNEWEVEELPIEDYLDPDGITLIEWPEKLGNHVPEEYFKIEFEFVDENHRNIKISSKNDPSRF
ncbi:tRNA (adenosine(37)-N6)-threonylcarbamoyltransferase complex ATPase subunit type 1 TsaE [Athalassotoga saccharophila]|uniref:tRNA (adenosine(37)-N6)-threonylcarbamoyltransferase complex ATPase subunit type 1 TsaE n=1 Tax=Athalassotoga saccharophila TaxID=1441386 RepID=UPI001379A0A3|nr:tRNA (adenosine(37)-N6)-threonylcarbamoyltransferase complex ATPase subunit type 1 TsaE [Athalassotoga saccharophila]BBJ27247.1 tRNA threonylcarbamoyladenosine biosynthesis protein TsaE [Athalassotoga saccharophila]